MRRVPVREVAFAALHQHLRAAFAELSAEQIERNPLNEVGSEDRLPVLRCYDGGQAPGDLSTVPEVGYRVEYAVEGFVGVEVGEQAPELGARLNLLHARLIEALCPGDPIVVSLLEGHLELWLDEADLTIDMMGVDRSDIPTARFLQEFVFEIRANRGAPFVELP